jgi:hypothetical protein
MTTPLRSITVAGLVLITACGRLGKRADEDGGAGGSAAATASGGAQSPDAGGTPVASSGPSDEERIKRDGYCEATVEGALTGTAKVPGGPMTFGSEYFMNEAEIRTAVGALAGPGKVDEAMKQDPRMYILLLNCKAGELALNFAAGMGTKYKDMPFAPGKYKIGNERGRVHVMLAQGSKDFFRPTAGDFEFTRFDKSGAKGSFSVAAKSFDGSKSIQVKGTFDLGCPFPNVAMCKK